MNEFVATTGGYTTYPSGYNYFTTDTTSHVTIDATAATAGDHAQHAGRHRRRAVPQRPGEWAPSSPAAVTTLFVGTGAGAYTIATGDGNDTITTGSGSTSVAAGAGNNLITLGAGAGHRHLIRHRPHRRGHWR